MTYGEDHRLKQNISQQSSRPGKSTQNSNLIVEKWLLRDRFYLLISWRFTGTTAAAKDVPKV
jgi:hypothetical protein